MVVAEPEATLLTVCELGYGKRTTFGPGDEMAGRELAVLGDENAEDSATDEAPASEEVPVTEEVIEEPEEENEDLSSANRYRTQRRGGKGVIDIKTTKRNGRVIGIVPVSDLDELLMMTVRGKIQRVAAKDISVIGRNTQGVRIMSLDEGDTLTAIVRVLPEDIDEAAIEAALIPPTVPDALPEQATSNEPDSEMDSSEEDSES
jgi:DNA gyrase subunit A